MTLETTSVYIPPVLVDGIIDRMKTDSVVMALGKVEPQLYGEHERIVFTEAPKAEFVGESQPKNPTTAKFESFTAKPITAQATVRVSNQFMWADEDQKIGYMKVLVRALSKSLVEALDLGCMHGISPLQGTVSAMIDNYIGKTENVVDAASGDVDARINAALEALITSDVDVTGLALSKAEAWALSQTTKANGDLKYPNLGFGQNMTDFKGLDAIASKNVSADGATSVIAGDWAGALHVGLIRDIPVEVIPYGDPDGKGDLKRHNQVALRAEAVFSWFAELDRFAVVKAGAEAGD